MKTCLNCKREISLGNFCNICFVAITEDERKILLLKQQLAAKDVEIASLKKTVDEIAALNEKMNDDTIQWQAAARKLAEEIAKYNPGSEMEHPEYWLTWASEEVTG